MKERKENERMTGMSVKEAIERYGCKKKNCPYLDEKGYCFCKAIGTKDFCLNKNR